MLPSRRAIVGTIAGLTIVMYVGLVCLAAGCLFMHVAPSGGHEHHAADPSHSPLCAWSCQAVSNSALPPDPPMTAAAAMGLLDGIPDSPIISGPATALLKSRAPPLPVFA